MLRKSFVTLFMLAQSIAACAWQQSEPLTIGTRHLVESKLYEAPRALSVALPEDYDETDEKLPVLYVLDGQKWFLEALSQYRVLASYEYVPPMIIVGIETEDSPRFGFFAQGEKLQNHLEQEVFPYVEQNFRASTQRMVIGWQFAASFLLQTLAEKPQLFDAWFAASPFPIQGRRMNLIKESLEAGNLKNETVVFATSLDENNVEVGAIELAALLENKAPQSLHWKYVKLQHEPKSATGHRTTPFGTLYSGFRTFFENYPVLEFNDLDEYKALGGHAYVKDYYQRRSNIYGFHSAIPDEGMFYLIRICVDADDLTVFDFYMQQFKNKGLIESNNIGWNMNFADFYLKHNQPEKALDLYELVSGVFPESARPIHGLARAYQAMNNRTQAIDHYEKAIAMAERTNDSRLSRYQSDYQKMKEDN